MTVRWLPWASLLTILALVLSAPAAAQTSVDLAPDKDNTLYEDANGTLSNGQGAGLFAGTTGGRGPGIVRGLLHFDLSSALPANARLDSVRLTMNMSRTNSGAHPISLHRVSMDWGEGSSVASGNGGGNGGPAQSGDATWLHTFFNTNLWSTPGGSFNASPSATTMVSGNGSYSWRGAGLTADVQAWLDGASSNFGWTVRGTESGSGTAKRFDSREGNTPPRLTLFFSTGTALDAPAEIPGGARLVSNHPNPFAEATTITYEVADARHVRLAVYDVLGRRIRTLVDGMKPAGTHRATFEAGTLPPGLYIYRLTAGTAAQNRTMTLLR